MSVRIGAAWDASRKIYGARKVWHVLRREGEDVARCTVERLMRSLGIRGVVRDKKVITTQPDTSQPCPPSRQISLCQIACRAMNDKVNRLFKTDRPNKLWGEPLCAIRCPAAVCPQTARGGSRTMANDFTYVPIWSGIVDVAPRHCLSDQWRSNGSINDVFARRIVALRDLHANPFRVTAGAARHSRRPNSFSTHLTKPSGRERRLITRIWFITRTADHNTCR